jgi:hypothetical protein
VQFASAFQACSNALHWSNSAGRTGLFPEFGKPALGFAELSAQFYFDEFRAA